MLTTRAPLLVTAAVIMRADTILIARRLTAGYGSGGWEFPGGKVMPGESPEAALQREILEELAVSIAILAPFMDYMYSYPRRTVRLVSFKARIISGTPVAIEHAELAWVLPRELPGYPFLPADVPIVTRLTTTHTW